jgi:hypothetical protein
MIKQIQRKGCSLDKKQGSSVNNLFWFQYLSACRCSGEETEKYELEPQFRIAVRLAGGDTGWGYVGRYPLP